MSGSFSTLQIAAWPWAEGAVILFGTAWGAILGSFVNVVVHRLPRGESVVASGSRCPACGAAIRPSDNIPCIGWLRLRGRCRGCGLAISPHYPLVEAGCGLVVGVLAAAELAGGGRWLPGFGGGFPVGIDRLLRGDWQLLLAFVLHAAAILTVITWCLLDRAGWPPPARLLAIPLAVAVTLVAAVPVIGPPPIDPLTGSADAAWPPGVAGGWPAAVAGAAVGGVWGRLSSAAGVRLGLPLLGSVLGWQAVTVLAIVTAVLPRAAAMVAGSSPRAGLFLAVAATLWIALWRQWAAFFAGLADWLVGR